MNNCKLKNVKLDDFEKLSPQYPLVREKRKTYFIDCLLCNSGPLVISASVPVGGYVPGQTIELLLQVDNRTDRNQNFTIHIIKVNVVHIRGRS